MANKYRWEDTYQVVISTALHKSDESAVVIPLSEVTVEVEIPKIYQNHLDLIQVEQLRETIKTERANSYARITAIEEKIQSLLCIEQGE